MLYRLIFFILTVSTLAAATPKPFAAVGDPLYRNIGPLKHLTGLHVFKAHQKEFNTLIEATQTAKHKGFLLEKVHSKEAADNYITRLRGLEKRHRHTAHIIKKVQLNAIAEDRSKRFRQIMRSQHTVFSEDTTLHREISRYERKLEKRHRVETARRQAYYKTAAHLNGTWEAKEQHWIFADERLSIVTTENEKIRTLEGSWTIQKQQLQFHIDTITNRHHQKPSHARKTAVKRSYRLLAIGKNRIKAVTPKQGEITLFRK